MEENKTKPAVQEEASANTSEGQADTPTIDGVPEHIAYDVTQDNTPVPKAVLKRKNWFARHKVLTVLLILILLVGGIYLFFIRPRLKAVEAASASYQFVRTTTLEKTSLSNSVTTTGTVAAGSEASVTVSDSAKLYKVTEVCVSVGDDVKEGDVIAYLDTTEVLKSIEKAKQSYNDTLTSAQTSYDRAVDNYNTAVVEHENKLIDLQAKIDEADKTASDAQTTVDNAQASYDAAAAKYNEIKAAMDSANASISSFSSSFAAMETQLNAYLSALNTAIEQYSALLTAVQNEYAADPNTRPASYDGLCAAASNMLTAYYNYNANGEGTTTNTLSGSSNSAAANAAATISSASANTVSVAVIESQVNSAYPGAVWQASYTGCDYSRSALGQYEAAAQNLSDAQGSVSNAALGYSSYAEMEQALTSAETQKTTAENTLKQAKTSLETATTQQKTARDNYDTEKNSTTIKTRSQSVEDAKTQLEQAKRTPDNLETLQTTLENCTLTATMTGTVTALNATVGSVCSGTVATIQDTDGLTVSITVTADKMEKVAVGMSCFITTDTTDETIPGTLTQIDPTANAQGTFGAKVSVIGTDTGLLIGTSAQVEIMESQTDNVFVVPIDAVGTADDGSLYVLRKTGGEGVDMTFEEVTVTTGAANDYYTEISGEDLAEGDVIRSSADLTEGIESSDNTQDPMSAMMGGGMGGGGGAEVTISADGGGGAPPSGGGGGGGAPGGM